MTHTYKVGDKGKTRGGDDYEVTAVGRSYLLVVICGKETTRNLDGSFYSADERHGNDLGTPELPRLCGWIGVSEHGEVYGLFKEKPELKNGNHNFLSLAYIDIEEGEGL